MRKTSAKTVKSLNSDEVYCDNFIKTSDGTSLSELMGDVLPQIDVIYHTKLKKNVIRDVRYELITK